MAQEQGCIFCKIARGEIPSEKILENDTFIVIKDVYPKVKGHTLIIPKEHYETFKDLPSELYSVFMKTTQEAIEKVLHQEKTHAYNLLMNNHTSAGQLVPHLHLHLLPRKEGDGFNLRV